MNVNPSPKTRFQSIKKNISDHRDMIASQTFQTSSDHALMEYAGILAKLPLGEAAASHFKMMGAQEFLQTFRNMGEMPTPVSPRIVDNLNHEA